MSHGEIERFKPIDWDDTGFYLKIAHLFRKNQPLKPAATVLYGVLGPVDVLKGHIIRRSQLCLKEFFLSTKPEVEAPETALRSHRI